nr:MAG TPA: replisome organizer protein [Caudoviricetes sp.]
MAWISVHERLIGAKLRKLSKKIGCSQNEAIGILVRLWLWGIGNASKDGCVSGADKKDISEILCVGMDMRYRSIKVVDALIETGWIDFNEEYYIHDWDEWQEQWYKAMQIRERDAARKREQRQIKKIEKISNQNNNINNQVEDKNILKVTDASYKPEKKVSVYSVDFETFWKEYPRKVGKSEAYKKYKARLNDGWRESELLEAAKVYSEKVIREHTEEKYVKHAKTFLSENTPFADYIKSDTTENSVYTDNENPYEDWRD